MRYAPRPPGSRPWVRRTALGLVLVAIIAAAGFGAYKWTQTKYYVAASDGRVAVYQGVPFDVPGVNLHRVAEVSDIELTTLPEYSRSQVEAGIEAQNRDDANDIVANLEQFVAPTPSPSPTSTPTPTKTPSAAS